MKRVGIIGGMGPEATVDLFVKIIKNTDAKKDQEHIPIVIDNYPQIPDRTAYIFGRGESPLPYLLESVRRLERASVDCLCMACNTAHYFIDKLRREAKVPFISMIETVLEKILDEGDCKKIGLMATDGTVKARIYHNAFEKAGLKIHDFEGSIQSLIMESIYKLKAGEHEQAKETFQNAIETIKAESHDCLIAGCTEVPVLLSLIDRKLLEGIKIFDATELLAKKIVSMCKD